MPTCFHSLPGTPQGVCTLFLMPRLALSPSLQEMSDVSFRSECVAGRSQRPGLLYQPPFWKEDILGRGNVSSCVFYLSPFSTNFPLVSIEWLAVYRSRDCEY